MTMLQDRPYPVPVTDATGTLLIKRLGVRVTELTQDERVDGNYRRSDNVRRFSITSTPLTDAVKTG